MNKKYKRDEVHSDIIEYHKLKEAWGLGPIVNRMRRCPSKHGLPELHRKLPGMENKDTAIYGHYIDYYKEKRCEFLGYTIGHARHRLVHVKSYIKNNILHSRVTGTGCLQKSKSTSYT